MKILFFGLCLLTVARAAAAPAPGDPYLAFRWHAVRPGKLPPVDLMRPAIPPLETFRLALRPGTPMLADLMTQCGMPSDECAYAAIPEEQRVPRYPGGRLYRYDLRAGHVYIWTSSPDGKIALAIYRSTAGTGELLYKST